MAHTNHRLHYLILAAGLTLGLSIFFLLAEYPSLRLLSAIFTCLFYFLWGVLHHLAEGTLHPKIALEYLLISLFAAAVLVSLVLRA